MATALGLANDPIDEVVPSLCVADGQASWGHCAHHEEESPEISRMHASPAQKVVCGACEQEGEHCGADREGSQLDQG